MSGMALRKKSKYMVGILISLIELYQKFLSPYLGNCCRFTPSCSEYAKETLAKDGLVKGLFKTLYRIARCNPFSKGGYDPVEKNNRDN
jgi:putative membrane protein insertion efficiency factor